MNTIGYYKEHFDQLQSSGEDALSDIRRDAFDAFSKLGIPTTKHEEWKYTRISPLFNKAYQFPVQPLSVTATDIDQVRLPGHEQAN